MTVTISSSLESACGTHADCDEKFCALFTTMNEGFALHEIITNDLGQPVDYRFIEVNPSFERLTGTCKEAIVGKTVLEIFPDVEKVWIERYGRVALTGKPENFTEYNTDTCRWYEVSSYSPARGLFASVFADITDNRRLEEQLRQSQKMESIGTLAGGVAHDFNNILTVIMGACSMLQMKLSGNTELLPFVQQILTSSERAAKLTHSLLAFSRKQDILPLSVNVNEIASMMQDFLGRIIGEDIKLETVYSSEKLPVCVDRGQIEQVLMNLAVNARDAMPAGGILRLETARADSRAHSLELEGCASGSYARITVSDSGIGMDAATKSRIFEPFFTTKEIGYGTGLGLSMAYGIVRQHGGKINVYSEPGVGTVFRIYLPMTEHPSPEPPEKEDSSVQGGGETILLVEDAPEVRDATRAILECVGYTVISADNGLEAIKMFEQYAEGISLVILDVIMPDMDGKEVWDVLRVMRRDIRVLFVSGYTSDILYRKGILPDAGNFLSKPLETSLFLKRVRESIDA